VICPLLLAERKYAMKLRGGFMGYSAAAWEWAMRMQDVMLRAMSGEIHGFQAADILGMTPRNLRRWRERYERWGYNGLVDQRRCPSKHRVPMTELERVMQLYRKRYRGFNGRHFHDIARREHGVLLSYSYVKQALQQAGLLPKRKPRGRHRRRREPRPCFGELLHLEGSPHHWLALVPDWRGTLITVVDDATKALLYAQLWPQETIRAVMSALAHVVRTEGLPMALYTDRAGWAFHTPKAGGPVAKTRVTQVGRALRQLGIAHIPAYSPQARGRSERMNRTLQGRLVNELRVAGITTVAAANRYLRDRYLPPHNATFRRAPHDPATAFVPLGSVDLDKILCQEEERMVAPDNTVTVAGHVLQIDRQPGRRTCAGLRVLARQHLDSTITIIRPPAIVLGHFTAHGGPLRPQQRSGRTNDRPGGPTNDDRQPPKPGVSPRVSALAARATA
jgi:transposase